MSPSRNPRRWPCRLAFLLIVPILWACGADAAATSAHEAMRTVAADVGAPARVPVAGGPAGEAASRRLVVYVREGCPHCADAKVWLAQVVRERPGLEVVLRDVETDDAAMDALVEVSRRLGRRTASVPTFVVGDRAIVGFADAARSGPAILALLGPEPGTTAAPGPSGAAPSDGPPRPSTAPGPGVAADASGPGGAPGPSDGTAPTDANAQPDPTGPRDAGAPRGADATPDARAPVVPAGAPDTPGPAASPGTSAAFGSLRPGSAAFSIAMGLLDGINPCAMWALLYLLSMLLHLRERARIALLAGTFVAVTAAVHALVLLAWFDLFALARLARPIERAAGVAGLLIGALQFKDALAPGHGPSLSVPASARPGLGVRMRAVLAAPSVAAGIGAVIVLAIVVNVVELMCTAGFPAVFTATLARHVPDPTAARAHLALYMAGYATPAAVLSVAAVALLSSPRLTAGAGRWLKLASGAAIVAVALPMVWPLS